MKKPLLFLLVLLVVTSTTITSAQTQYRDLSASLAKIPGLADSPDEGAFVEVVKALDELYPGKINIAVYPFARSYNNIITGKVDFHIPAMRNPDIDESKLPYRYVTEPIGKLSFVVYSHVDKPITKKDIIGAMKDGGNYPFIIEVSAGSEGNCPFPVLPSNDWSSSMRKLDAKRIDAIWNPQEETDLVLQNLKFKTIKRSLWGDFEDVIVIEKNAKGEEVNTILSGLLKQLRESGKLQAIYSKVHKPYDDWQPAKMAW